METRSKEQVSAQIGVLGEINNLTESNFKLEDGMGFNIKVELNAQVELEVNLMAMPEGEFVKTTFYPGWNPEIVREVKQVTSALSANLRYGY